MHQKTDTSQQHRFTICGIVAVIALSIGANLAAASEPFDLSTADGFRGIWYANQPSKDEYQFKYSGGMATYPQQHLPIAVYAPEVRKTFFCYGGRLADKNRLLHMLSYFDHSTGEVARPRILLDKKTSDAHDNPTMQIDSAGHLWIFSNSHGTSRPSFIHRSAQPHSIESFELVQTTNFSYGQPWYTPDLGFVFLHTRYDKGRRFLHVIRSADGRTWEAPRPLSRAEQGHYQVSWRNGNVIGTAFNIHPDGKGLNARTNLYYMQSDDGGLNWQNAAGEKLELPLTERKNGALAIDYAAMNLLVYLKDLQFTADGKPVLLHLTSRGFESGPKNDPRTLSTARWTGSDWKVHDITSCDNNYDFASLYVESDGTWRLIGATEQGPQEYNTGGEIALWVSNDQGANWDMKRLLTRNSKFNHTYPRRPLGARPEFYALWADGDARRTSESSLYFTDREGTQVWRLPARFEGNASMAKPEVVQFPETRTEAK